MTAQPEIEKIRFGGLSGWNILMASISSPTSSPAFYERALRLNHNVLTFGPFRDHAFWQNQAESLKQHVFYRQGSAEHWFDICSRLTRPCDIVTPHGVVDVQQLRSRIPASFKPDLFLWVDQHGWNIPVNIHTLSCPKVAIFGDTHLRDNWDLWLKYALTFDFVFVTFNRHHIPKFKEAGCKRVYWSPAACDPEVHCRIPAEKIYPVSFVGGTYQQMHGDRVSLLRQIREAGIDLYIDAKLLQDMSIVFSRSKIVLNKSVAEDLNMRVFETLATGSLLITNRLPPESGLEELFSDRQHLVLYDAHNLIDLIRYYLNNDSEREAIAQRGWSEVLAHHTYEHRVREILQTVQHALIAEKTARV